MAAADTCHGSMVTRGATECCQALARTRKVPFVEAHT
jgi:hypothetical protein